VCWLGAGGVHGHAYGIKRDSYKMLRNPLGFASGCFATHWAAPPLGFPPLEYSGQAGQAGCWARVRPLVAVWPAALYCSDGVV
jgi:hypothetical protein